MEKVIYIPECLRAPTTPILVDLVGDYRAVLDENLSPVRCYRDRGERIECPQDVELGGQETLVVGWAAAEALASALYASYVDERKARSLIDADYGDLISAIVEAATRVENNVNGILEGTMLIVVPGNILKTRSWGVAIAIEAIDKPRLLGKFAFSEDLKPIQELVYVDEVFQRFGEWWQVPWEVVVSAGKSMRRLVEYITERPVERIPANILKEKNLGIRDVVRGVLKWAQTEEFEIYGRREINRAAVYIEGGLLDIRDRIIAVLVQRDGYRRIRARWLFDNSLKLVGFDREPPDAVTHIDTFITIGEVNVRKGIQFPEKLISFLNRQSIYSPARREDYMAIKTLRWYEVSRV